MMPWPAKLPSCAASSTTTSGSWCAVAAAVSAVSKSVRVALPIVTLMPVLAVNASKIFVYAFGESPAPRIQTVRSPVAWAFLEAGSATVAAVPEGLELLHAVSAAEEGRATAATGVRLPARPEGLRAGDDLALCARRG